MTTEVPSPVNISTRPDHEKILGATTLHFDTLDSTNTEARKLANQGAAEGVCVVAREQTAGRGRLGRNWNSPAGAGLYLSIILRPNASPARAAFITLAAAIAVAETLIQDFHTPADIKYPNDILVNGKKICGILVESSITENKLEYAILGIGVNIAQPDFPDELKTIATSLRIEANLGITPDEFLEPLLVKLNHWYIEALANPAAIIEGWQTLSSYARDAKIRVISNDSIIEGTTRGLTASGALLVELDDGQIREIVSGDITIRSLESGV
ncbi:MAG: biotin--[acetyl-CoA-carboxylase] ligase [Acidobacteriota bacterium]